MQIMNQVPPHSSRRSKPQERPTVSPTAPSTTGRSPEAVRTLLVRCGVALTLLASLLAFAARVHAQQVSTPSVSLRPIVGALVGTGAQHDALKSAVLVGGQASYALHENVAVVGTFSWSGSRYKLSSQQPRLDLYQYDVGLEGRLDDVTERSPVITRPYATFGAGERTYNLRSGPDAGARSNALLYSAVGLDLEDAHKKVGVRLEVRDNVTWFTGLRGELPELHARNDLQFSAGLTFGI
jgi:hypothetical protein